MVGLGTVCSWVYHVYQISPKVWDTSTVIESPAGISCSPAISCSLHVFGCRSPAKLNGFALWPSNLIDLIPPGKGLRLLIFSYVPYENCPSHGWFCHLPLLRFYWRVLLQKLIKICTKHRQKGCRDASEVQVGQQHNGQHNKERLAPPHPPKDSLYALKICLSSEPMVCGSFAKLGEAGLMNHGTHPFSLAALPIISYYLPLCYLCFTLSPMVGCLWISFF